jgi:hypothetical protein
MHVFEFFCAATEGNPRKQKAARVTIVRVYEPSEENRATFLAALKRKQKSGQKAGFFIQNR